MGNRPETWAKYYDLRKNVREGQDGLLGMSAWRQSMDALGMITEEVAAEELDAPLPAETEPVCDSDDSMGEAIDVAICLSSDSDVEDD
jgi:hypothetical protein